jgi:hypothetical protein
MAKKMYLELVQDILANDQHKGVYEEFLVDQNHQVGGLEIEEQSTTSDLQLSHDHVEDVTLGAGFFVGDLEVSFDKQDNEVDCTQGNNSLESCYDESYIHDASNGNSEEQPRITLKDNEQFQQGNNEIHILQNQLKISEDMVVASLVQYDSTHELVEELYRKIPREGEGDWRVADL